MASNSKQYGLIMPQKANQGLVRPRPAAFNDSSESEEEAGGATDWVRKALKRESEKTFQKKQHQLDIQKALEEDPTVYQYDEVYDKIEEKKAELINAKKQQDKKPRYIQSLLQQAEKRKREQERRNERIIQKEREAEGDKFKDKESFVTSAYRQKLEEFKMLEEEERRQDAIEALTDVSKQKDLSGFYRHLYRVTVSGESETVAIKQEKDESPEKSKECSQVERQVEEMPIRNSEDVDTEKHESLPENSSTENVNNTESSDKQNKRHYRKRRSLSASSDSHGEDTSGSRNKITAENIDADSDFSVDSDSSASGSDSSRNSKRKKQKHDLEEESSCADKNSAIPIKIKEKAQVPKILTENQNSVEEETNTKDKVGEKDVEVTEGKLCEEKKENTPKPNIWVKRTVGEVFENALQRYYERKAAKLASKG